MMKSAICIVSVAPLRAEASHRSEMVSQLLFGETCTIIDEKPGWKKVQCTYDNYEGWCQSSQTIPYDQQRVNESELLTASWSSEVTLNGRPMYVPMGCPVQFLHNGVFRWEKNHLSYKGETYPVKPPAYNWLLERVMLYRNTPYLWGGRSVFGIDCSGYTQAVYRYFGIPLPRDAYQQAEKGQVVEFLQSARIGDLAFFEGEEGKIVHVGILLNEHELIHSSGTVRIDKIDTEGIVHSDTGERTHKLRIIKRYF